MIADRYRSVAALLLFIVCSSPAIAAGESAAAGVLLSNRALALDESTGKVFAVDESRDSLLISDPSTGTSVSVAVGTRPDAVAVNSVSGRVYVANSRGGTVTVLDAKTNAVLTTVKAGPHPYVLAVDETANQVYVANTFSDSVAVLDGTANTVAMRKFGSTDNVLADAHRSRVFLIGYEDPNLRILDVKSGSLNKVMLGEHLWGMALNSETGALYVTRIGDASVIEVETETGRTHRLDTGNFPCAVDVNEKTGKIYVANYGDDSVTVIDGKQRKTLSTVRVGSRPQSLAVDKRANLIYVADTHGRAVTVIDGDTNSVKAVLSAGPNPFAVIAGATPGILFVANLGTPVLTALKAGH